MKAQLAMSKTEIRVVGVSRASSIDTDCSCYSRLSLKKTASIMETKIVLAKKRTLSGTV